MTEEENKAIFKLREIIDYDKKHRLETIFDKEQIEFRNNIELVLDLTEKLQKENEKWKENARIAEENDTTLVLDVNQACKELGISEDTIIADELADKMKEKYISKDKIRKLENMWNDNIWNATDEEEETKAEIIRDVYRGLLDE